MKRLMYMRFLEECLSQPLPPQGCGSFRELLPQGHTRLGWLVPSDGPRKGEKAEPIQVTPVAFDLSAL